MTVVLDSSALIALLKNEEGSTIVQDVIDDSGSPRVVHAVNLCEVYYDTMREFGERAADAGTDGLLSTNLILREDMDMRFWRFAGAIKAHVRRASLADCFCAALANRLEGEVLTCDREFSQIADRGICRVRFIR